MIEEEKVADPVAEAHAAQMQAVSKKINPKESSKSQQNQGNLLSVGSSISRPSQNLQKMQSVIVKGDLKASSLNPLRVQNSNNSLSNSIYSHSNQSAQE